MLTKKGLKSINFLEVPNENSYLKVVLSVLVFVILFSASAALAAPPIKIGLLVPLSGAYAREGEFIRNGMLLAFEQAGDIAGRKVNVIVEDTEMKPATGADEDQEAC